jgi:hypothetical protein
MFRFGEMLTKLGNEMEVFRANIPRARRELEEK